MQGPSSGTRHHCRGRHQGPVTTAGAVIRDPSPLQGPSSGVITTAGAVIRDPSPLQGPSSGAVITAGAVIRGHHQSGGRLRAVTFRGLAALCCGSHQRRLFVDLPGQTGTGRRREGAARGDDRGWTRGAAQAPADRHQAAIRRLNPH